MYLIKNRFIHPRFYSQKENLLSIGFFNDLLALSKYPCLPLNSINIYCAKSVKNPNK